MHLAHSVSSHGGSSNERLEVPTWGGGFGVWWCVCSLPTLPHSPPLPPPPLTTPSHAKPHQTTPSHTKPHQTTPRHAMPRHATPHHITPHHTTPHHRCFVFSPSASSLSLLLTSAPHARSTPSLWALVTSRSRVPRVPQRTNTDQTTATWFENLTLCLEPEHLSTMRRSHPLVLFALPQLRHTTICITPRLLPRMHFAGNATYGIAPIHSTGAQTTPSTSMSTSPRMSTQSSASPSSAQGGYEPTQMARINLRRMAELVGPSSVQCTHRHFRPLEIQLRDLRHNLRDHCADCQENVRHHTSSSADPTPHLTPNPSH